MANDNWTYYNLIFDHTYVRTDPEKTPQMNRMDGNGWVDIKFDNDPLRKVKGDSDDRLHKS